MSRGILSLVCVGLAIVAVGCGGDEEAPPLDGLSADELAQKLPDGGTSQAVAVDVDAARTATNLDAGADPTEVAGGEDEQRFGLGAFFAERDLAIRTDNDVRTALDHGAITAYAGHPYAGEGAVTLLDTSQPFDDIASSLEDAGWKRDGNVVSTDPDDNPDDPAGLGSYTAAAAGDGFLVLGYSADTVRSVADGDTEPSDTGELEILADLGDAPVRMVFIPQTDNSACITSITATDDLQGEAEVTLTVDGPADEANLPKTLSSDASSLGFNIKSQKVEGSDVIITTQDMPDEGFFNSPALLIGASLIDQGDPLYDCG